MRVEGTVLRLDHGTRGMKTIESEMTLDFSLHYRHLQTIKHGRPSDFALRLYKSARFPDSFAP